MTYEEFLQKDFPKSVCSTNWNYPLNFDNHQVIIEEAAGFSVIDDFMSDYEMESFIDDFESKFPHYKGLATLDLATIQSVNPEFVYDSYSEWFFCVDVSEPKQPVYLWTGESEFEKYCDSFDEFHNSLKPYAGDDE